MPLATQIIEAEHFSFSSPRLPFLSTWVFSFKSFGRHLTSKPEISGFQTNSRIFGLNIPVWRFQLPRVTFRATSRNFSRYTRTTECTMIIAGFFCFFLMSVQEMFALLSKMWRVSKIHTRPVAVPILAFTWWSNTYNFKGRKKEGKLNICLVHFSYLEVGSGMNLPHLQLLRSECPSSSPLGLKSPTSSPPPPTLEIC